MLMEVICLTISLGEWRSMTRLWIRIWNLSQVLEPSPQGVLRVVILKRFSRHSDGALDLETLLFGSLNQVAADLLQALHVSGREGNSDAMHGRLLAGGRLSSFRFDSCHSEFTY